MQFGRGIVGVFVSNHEWAIGHKRQAPGQRIKRGHTQAVNIAGAGNLRAATRQLRRDVIGSADQIDIGLGQLPSRCCQRFGDTKIGQQRSLVSGAHQNVAGFDVAVNNAALMGGIQRIGHILQISIKLARGQRLPPNHLL